MNEVKIRNVTVKDFWVWSQVRIAAESCPECGSGESITISKGKDLKQLIKVLTKLNYKGIPKNKFK